MNAPYPITRQEMQAEAMQIAGLINVAMGYDNPSDSNKLFCLLTMAEEHATRLNMALDSVNAREVVQ